MVPTESEGLAVEVRDLVKRYPKSPVNAVDGVSFAAAPGEVFGLLGPNGAGKTTTVGMLTTRVRPTAGTARIGGVDVVRDSVRARAQLAVVPQQSNLDRSISIRDNLIFHAAYHGMPAGEREERADELLDQFGLLDRAGDKPDFFSGGQSQRVMIARALMHAPRVLFLDEPTTGLDPAARLFVWDRLRELRDSDVTLILTTHDMDEAALLASKVGIMDHGHLLALDTPDALISSLEGEGTLELTADQPADGTVVDALAGLVGVPLGMAFQRAVLTYLGQTAAQTAVPESVFDVFVPVVLFGLLLSGLAIATVGAYAPAQRAARTRVAPVLQAE